MNNYLITWFYAENKDDESFYPSVGGNTSSPEFHRVYWKCIFDFYKSAILTNDDQISYIFFTNVPNIPTDMDGVNYDAFFKQNDIQIKQLELSRRTPSDWYGAWRNQLYEFDVLRELSKEDGNNYLILDSDILIRKSILPVFDDIAGNGAVCYECGYGTNQNINGISIEQMCSLYDEIYGGGYSRLTYYGGEFIGITSEIANRLVDEFDYLWNENYKRYEEKRIKLNEEAHFLSLLYYKLGVQNNLGNRYIRRMWTAPKCDTIQKMDMELPIWHLPAEKKYGFDKMFNWFKENESCTVNEYLYASDKIMGISTSRTKRALKKLIVKTKERLNQ